MRTDREGPRMPSKHGKAGPHLFSRKITGDSSEGQLRMEVVTIQEMRRDGSVTVVQIASFTSGWEFSRTFCLHSVCNNSSS